MALILPSSNDLQEYIEGFTDEQYIQQAMDLFVLATGLSATSSDLEDRLVKSAVLEMAWALGSRHEDREEEFSAFTSERIGSYSYNKAAKTIAGGQSTGVPSFDSAVAYFLSQALSGVASVSSEYVFAEDGVYGLVTSRDPSYSYEAIAEPLPSGPPVYIEPADAVGVDTDGNLFADIDPNSNGMSEFGIDSDGNLYVED